MSYRQSVKNNRENLVNVLGVTPSDVEQALTSEESSKALWRRYQREGDRLDAEHRDSVEARAGNVRMGCGHYISREELRKIVLGRTMPGACGTLFFQAMTMAQKEKCPICKNSISYRMAQDKENLNASQLLAKDSMFSE